MKVNTRSVNVNEFGLDIKSGSDMILRIIDNQINNYKIQFLTNWEGNHNLSPVDKNNKIQKLIQMKDELHAFLSGFDLSNDEIDFSLILDVKVKTPSSELLEDVNVATL